MGGQHDGLFLSGSPPVFTFVYTFVFSWQINSAAAACEHNPSVLEQTESALAATSRQSPAVTGGLHPLLDISPKNTEEQTQLRMHQHACF